MVACVCNPGYLRGEGGTIKVQSQPGQKHETLSEKQTKAKKAEGAVQG
jgi:hypothetical protein